MADDVEAKRSQRRIKIVSNGEPHGLQVVDAESGDPIQCFTELHVSMTSDMGWAPQAKMTLQFQPLEVEAIATFKCHCIFCGKDAYLSEVFRGHHDKKMSELEAGMEEFKKIQEERDDLREALDQSRDRSLDKIEKVLRETTFYDDEGQSASPKAIGRIWKALNVALGAVKPDQDS